MPRLAAAVGVLLASIRAWSAVSSWPAVPTKPAVDIGGGEVGVGASGGNAGAVEQGRVGADFSSEPVQKRERMKL